jgi:MFS transporter, MHS family, proline/betaine transporter
MNTKDKKIFLTAIMGNLLEYYDFTIYVVFSSIIGEQFFPHFSKFAQSILSLSVFAIGFLSRPLGGILFGIIGDKMGRKKSLIISILGMALPTIIIGLMPTYKEIGILAPILLCIMRFIQGFCISGEGTGVAIFVLEHYKIKPGLVAGIVHSSNLLGTMLSSVVGILINTYLYEFEWSWRIAFLLGGVFGLIGFYLRTKTSETPVFKEILKNKENLDNSLSKTFRNCKKQMFVTFLAGGFASSIMYIAKSIHVFYSVTTGLEESLYKLNPLVYLFYTSFIVMISMPISGIINDIVGRYKMMMLSSLATLFLITPIMMLASQQNIYFQAIGLTFLGILTGFVASSAYIFVIFLFEPRYRFLGVGFSYNLGIAIFGGTSPIISRALIEKTSIQYSPSFYIICTSIFFLITLYLTNKKSKKTPK